MANLWKSTNHESVVMAISSQIKNKNKKKSIGITELPSQSLGDFHHFHHFHLSTVVLREALVGVFPIGHQWMPRGRQVRPDLVPAAGEDAHQQQAEGGAGPSLENDGEMGTDERKDERKDLKKQKKTAGIEAILRIFTEKDVFWNQFCDLIDFNGVTPVKQTRLGSQARIGKWLECV